MIVPRATQIDAVELDSECLQMLKTQFSQATSHIKPGLLEMYEPEIMAVLGLAVYVVPLYTTSRLVGQQLLAIKFSSNQRRILLYGIALVTARWLQRRLRSLLPSRLRESSLYKNVSKLSRSLNIVLQIANLANTLVFLKQGAYPTLLHRLLRLRTQSCSQDGPGALDFSFMTRELLWHSFAELFMFTLPLLNIQRLKRFIINLGTRGAEAKEVEKSFVPINSPCAQCNQPPILPRRAACHHIFCYYCLEANRAADPEYRCPLCLHNVAE